MFPLTATPDKLEALPELYASAPARMSVRNDAAGDCIFGLRSRWNAYATLCAVTVCPVLNLYAWAPLLTVNTYVLPSLETRGMLVASSGWSWLPAGAGLSG